jgi:hypothetical protein
VSLIFVCQVLRCSDAQTQSRRVHCPLQCPQIRAREEDGLPLASIPCQLGLHIIVIAEPKASVLATALRWLRPKLKKHGVRDLVRLRGATEGHEREPRGVLFQNTRCEQIGDHGRVDRSRRDAISPQANRTVSTARD